MIVVTDGGDGIPASSLDEIFERFARTDDSRSRREGGAGLGLAIVAAIARAHGGSCSARNVAGAGASIELRLPLRQAAQADEEQAARPAADRRPGSPARICLNRRVTALYRKYRPQTFAEVVGQEAVVRTLTNAIEQGKVRQAYLFAGPRGTGKTSLARILAKSVNCAHGPTPTPDNTCHACVAITNGTSLDVIEMDAASQRGIDDIREIRERVVLQPVEGRSKVYILDEAHQLTDAAWNALLKLIEEPPPHLLFIFCTTELQKVLPTVRSRCQTFVFQRPRLPELVRKLRLIADGEQIDVPDAALALIARGGARRLPRRRVDARPARLGDRRRDHRAGRAAAARRGRGRGALPALRPGRRRRHRGRAASSSRSSPSRARISAGSSPTCSSTCGTCCSSST